VAFPVRHQVESPHVFDYPQRRLKEISRRLEVPLLDLLPLLRAEYESSGRAGRPLFFDQCHVTPYGSELVARMIYTFLKRVPAPAP
jgi:lysophospholipase L1-like esterase